MTLALASKKHSAVTSVSLLVPGPCQLAVPCPLSPHHPGAFRRESPWPSQHHYPAPFRMHVLPPIVRESDAGSMS